MAEVNMQYNFGHGLLADALAIRLEYLEYRSEHISEASNSGPTRDSRRVRGCLSQRGSQHQ